MENVREVYRYVDGTNGRYGVSPNGVVVNLKGHYMLEPIKGRYVSIGGKTRRICDLVANAWLPNPRMWAYVKHKDGDASNNRVSNLSWSREKEVLRGKARLLARRVLQFDKMGGLVNKFNSIGDASLVSGVDKSSISRCCHGSASTAGGFKWRFESGE